MVILLNFLQLEAQQNKDWSELTKKQLSDWGVNYHELIMGKPEGDVFIDDKAFNSENWNWDDINSIIENQLIKLMIHLNNT